MKTMTRLLPVVLAALLLPLGVRAQGVRYDNVAFTTAGNGLPHGAAFLPNAIVTVCTSSGAGLPCSPLATVYANPSLTTPSSNPITADAKGNYGFWAAPGTYVVTVTAPGYGGYTSTITLPCQPASSCTITGNMTFSGAMNANNGGTLSGTFTGNPLFSGRPLFKTFSAMTLNRPAAMEPLASDAMQHVTPAGSDSNDGLSWGTAKATIAAANAAIIASGATAGIIYVSGAQTVSSTLQIGQNSPTHVPVRLVLLPSAILTVTITNGTDVFELANKSSVVGSYSDYSYGPMDQIQLGNSALVNDVFRALNQDATQEAMSVSHVGVYCNSGGGARLEPGGAVFDFSELFNGTFLRDVAASNYESSTGQAWGIKIQTKAGATDGAGAMPIDDTWLVPTPPNAGWVDIDTTPNRLVHINNIWFTHMEWEGTASMTKPMIVLTSGANGTLRNVGFHDGEWVDVSPPSNSDLVSVNGCYNCSWRNIQANQNGTISSGVTIFSLASGTTYGNSFDNISAGGGGEFTDWLIDNNASPAVTLPVSTSGSPTLTHYSQADTGGRVSWQQAQDYLLSSTAGQILTLGGNGISAGTIAISAASSGSHTFATPYSAAPDCTASPTSNPGKVKWWVPPATTTAVTVDLSASATITFTFTCTPAAN